MLTALAGALQRPGAGEYEPDDSSSADPADLGAFLMQSLLPLLIGVWSGSMIGQLAHHALGQYDLPLPLHGPPTQRFLVHNVEAFGAEWELAGDELRYALALREVVHGGQRSVPWVREELERLATAYVGAYEVQPDALQEQLGDIDFSDPSASMANFTELGDPSLLLGAMRSERQAPLLEDLQRFVSVLEGYTDIVVETLGGQMMSSHAAHRRGVETSPARAGRSRRVRRPAPRPPTRPRPLRRGDRVHSRRRRAGRPRSAQPAVDRPRDDANTLRARSTGPLAGPDRFVELGFVRTR